MTKEIATERLWFNADRTKLVKDGDPEAASLAAAVGDEIPDLEPDSAADKGVIIKQAEKAANKAAKADEDK
jgi:hypothetical protein